MIEGNLVFMRHYEPTDLEAFAGLVTDTEVMNHAGGTMTREGAEHLFCRLLGGSIREGLEGWAVLDKTTGLFIGHGGWQTFSADGEPEVLFLIHRTHWGRGFGGEVARLLVDHLFTHHPHERIYATVDLSHSASIRVLTRIGMECERQARDDRGPFDVYVVHRRVWEERHGRRVLSSASPAGPTPFR